MPKISADYVLTSVTNVQMNAECSKTSIARHVQMNAAGVLRNAAAWLECRILNKPGDSSEKEVNL
ncbi:hypothetical protein [Phosphitispora fastidiosa]|uniref:hypothetical protein n=1 Tax=Phosphitispora fastidiosa TaxID=2837202 RepID=UPI002F400E3A|nr:hypothetical protein [Phosphitispora fastidiosa]